MVAVQPATLVDPATTAGLLWAALGSILPVLALAGVGYLLGRRGLDVGPLNTVTVYVLAPALVFYTLVTTTIGGAVVAKLALGVVAYTVGMTALAAAVARARDIHEPLFGAVVLAATYPNSGNMGIPISDFAFGPVGRNAAVLFLAVQSVLIYTFGAYTAARGGRGDGAGEPSGVWSGAVRRDLGRVLKLPLVYAVGLALAARWLGVVPAADTTAMQTVQLTGEAAIPVLQLVLGASLASLSGSASGRDVALPGVLKLVVAPALALGVALALDFGDPTVGRVFVLEAAMPAAITPVVLVGEFGDADTRRYLSGAVLATTLASVPLLAVLIALLRAGVLL
ncbi:MAG: AEC family transporter [Halobacteriaceae archaeon]